MNGSLACACGPAAAGPERLLDEGFFIEIGFLPNADCVAHLAERGNERGEIMVGTDGGTSVPGVFAAGDVANGLREADHHRGRRGARTALAAGEYLRNCSPLRMVI